MAHRKCLCTVARMFWPRVGHRSSRTSTTVSRSSWQRVCWSRAFTVIMAEPVNKKSKTAELYSLRLVQFESDGRQRVGALTSMDGDVVDICAVDAGIPTDMKRFLEKGDSAMQAAQQAVTSAQDSGQHILKKGSFSLKAPIYDPQKLMCIGMNYRGHCTEQNVPVPKEPLIFSKFSSAITEPDGAVIIDEEETQEVDYEVELAVVIGKQGKKIPESDALSYVAGFMVAHDVSARDWQMRRNGGQWLIGKTFDTFCPIGPAIVTMGAISDPHNLGIRCRLNGQTVQDSNTADLVHKTEALIAFCSRLFTLNPGDIILTGTPPGVGCFKKPPLWLKKGDIVECEIDELGTIRNEIQ